MEKRYSKQNLFLVAPYEIDQFESVSFDEALKWLKNHSTLALDTETRDINGFTELIMLQFGDDSSAYVLDTRNLTEYQLSAIASALNGSKIIGVNLKYDLKVLINNIPSFTGDVSVYDLMLVDKIIDGDTSSSFASLVNKYLNIDFYLPVKIGSKKYVQLSLFPEFDFSKDTRTEFIKLEDDPFTPSQALYGAYDVLLAYRVYNVMSKKISSLRGQNKFTIDLENRFVKVLVEMELNGMPINLNKWDKVVEKIDGKLNTVLNKLNKIADIN